jgi:ABC-type sugar transport system ATPase subunit
MPDDSHQTRSEYLLQLEHVSKSYGGLRALNDVSVGIHYAEIHCLVGQNGSGKSTLIKIVSGVEHADSGEILFDNKPLHSLHAADSIHRGIQVIYQDPSPISTPPRKTKSVFNHGLRLLNGPTLPGFAAARK